MAYFMENCSVYLNDCLNYPISTRCTELSRLIDCGSLKDLHDFFPTLVKSIFTAPGWGLRTIAQNLNPLEFDYLYNFFIPLGPMFRLCYRLLSEPIKFEVPVDALPSRTIQMLNSGRFSVFYSDIVSVDPCRRQVTSLHLNAFDYFIFHFALHGMIPLHKMYPAALTVHNDLLKTVFYFLTADYLCTFLPTDPNTTVMPANVFCSIKSAAPMPISPMMPVRQPKYLSSIMPNFTANSSNIRTPESSRSSCWRTETVLHLFVDTWLRLDVDESPDLPSSEFIRVVRVLVKQLHAFANSTELDVTPMAALRSLAQPMMSAQMSEFLRNIIHRWPLDSSFSVVLELWLCYIQPWRYTLNKQYGIEEEAEFQGQIPSKYERFINENSATYTQIFIQLLPRFERLDFSSLKNVSMLYRLAKVFGQSNLPLILRAHDARLFNEHLTSPIKASSLSLNISSHSSPNTSHVSPNTSRNVDTTDYFDATAGVAYGSRSELLYVHEGDDIYICMFGPHMVPKLQNFVQKLLFAHEDSNKLIKHMESARKKRYSGIVGTIKWYLLDDEDNENTRLLMDAKKTVEVLEFIIDAFASIFEDELPNIQEMVSDHQERSRNLMTTSPLNESFFEDNFDSREWSPRQEMLRRVRQVEYTGDPLVLPANSSEIAPLVRLQYKLSHYLNEKYGSNFESVYHRNDFAGILCRHLLEPPRTIKTFEKCRGVSQLVESRLGPRVNLRWLASYRFLILILLSSLLGKLIFGGPLFGFFVLIVIKFLIVFFVSAYDMLITS